MSRTYRTVVEQGLVFKSRHRNQFRDEDSKRRFELLKWIVEARRHNLRAANRKWLRRNGKSLKMA